MPTEYLAPAERGERREGCGKRQVSEGYNLTLRRSDTTTTLRFEANWHCETERALPGGVGGWEWELEEGW